MFGLIVLAALGGLTLLLNTVAKSYLPDPPWLKTMGTATSIVVGGLLIRERFKAQDR